MITLIGISISSFILALFFGILMLTYVWPGRKVPRVLSLTHGSFASLGLVCLILSAFSNSYLWISVGIFAVAAMGGLYMFVGHDLKGVKPPKHIALIHGLLALTGFAILLASVFIITN